MLKIQSNEPPSRSHKCLLAGRDCKGHWVVKDQKGLCGGIFVDRAQALKYAMYEVGRRMQSVIMVPGILELDTPAMPASASAPAAYAPRRRVA